MQTKQVAIGGLGAIGAVLAKKLDEGIPGLELAAVSGRDLAKAERFVATLKKPVPVLPLNKLAEAADIVVEAAPSSVMDQIAIPTLTAGRWLVMSSVGALMRSPHYIDLAREHGGRIFCPTGALIGLDAMLAAREGIVHSIKMVTRKPPGGLEGAPYLVENNISVTGLTAPKLVFSGTAVEAIKGFPANVNVAVALGLAGIGPDKTNIEIWADPGVDRNTHSIAVDADSARFTMMIENIPSAENPRTGKITALSVIALLRKMAAPLSVGT
ncbi:MAG: aspartate dehydrogenase [Betaproteobacteria bacterium]|nr:aspartate dehydrogenase [Betaproteobacteria bacterium]